MEDTPEEGTNQAIWDNSEESDRKKQKEGGNIELWE